MTKRLFDRFILGYERPLWQMVRQAGKIVWVHCHGKIATVLDDFVVGNIEWDALQHGDPDEIEAAVRRAICAGGRKNFILGASADAVSEPDDQMVHNIRRFFESGLRYGAHDFTQEEA